MNSRITAISYYLPETKLTNAELSLLFPEWTAEKIQDKTGIKERSISANDEYSLELGEKAARKLLDEHNINKDEIDFILYCSQTPKYLIATSACVLQHRLNIPSVCGALDINLGCSGYVYSLALADGLIKSGQAKKILLITADTYTKLIAKDNRQLKTIFSDGATASLITESDATQGIQGFNFGTDGSGAEKLISKKGGLQGLTETTEMYQPDLHMEGPEIFNFTLNRVPNLVNSLLTKSNLGLHEIDLFIFHQANNYMLEHLRKKIGIPAEKFYYCIENTGNTVSSTIPISLTSAIRDNVLEKNMKIMLVGFGVGFSWAGAVINW